MTQFVFDQIPSGQLVQLEDDLVLFHGGSASAASVTFGMTANGVSTVDITFNGHTVEFDSGATVVAANGHMIFDDGSHLLIGGPRQEQFDGGSGNDALFGNAGNDTLDGHGGDNLIQGNQGDDVLRAQEGNDTIYGGQGDDLITTDDSSILFDQEFDFAQGNKGDDTINGGQGSDILLGGQGNDLILASAAPDILSGDRGSDTLGGGQGADVFHVTADGSTDRITDFTVSEGDRVQVDPGTMFHLTQVGADTVITFEAGGQVVLVGVQMSTLTGSWIFGA